MPVGNPASIHCLCMLAWECQDFYVKNIVLRWSYNNGGALVQTPKGLNGLVEQLYS